MKAIYCVALFIFMNFWKIPTQVCRTPLLFSDVECMGSRDIAILIALQWFSVVHHSSLFQYFFIDPTLVEYSTMLWAYTYFEKNWNRFVMELHKSYRILFIFMEQIHHFLTLKFQDRPFHPMNQMVSFWQGWNSQIIVLFWHCS